MFDNFIRGGQIFIHNIAMFKQVLGKTIMVSFVVASIITTDRKIDEFKRINIPAVSTYVKANILEEINEHNIFKSDKNKRVARLDAYTKDGLFHKQAAAKNIIKFGRFKNSYNQFKELIIWYIYTISLLSLALIIAVFFIWSMFGKAAKSSKNISGNRILNSKEASKILRRKRIDSDIIIGGVPLIKDSETKHILITGSTGSGKTNCMHTILPQVRKKNNQLS